MQLDIFEHSRDVILRNAVIDALRNRAAGACAPALEALEAECGGDPLLPSLRLLCARLRAPIAAPLTRVAAGAILRELDAAIDGAARQVFAGAAPEWMAPLWAALAGAGADFPFDAGDELPHAAPLLLRAGRWTDAVASVEGIASWRRQPAPLGWMIEARCRSEAFEAIWPLFAELAWMAPERAQILAARLQSAPLDDLMRDFHGSFEAAGRADDFAWFPAWALIVARGLEAGLRLAWEGANTPQESCARILLRLLALERQGRHAELIEARRKLREAHPAIFARYMQDR